MLGQIVLFAQHHAQAAAGRIACDGRTIDAAPDNQYVVVVPLPRLLHGALRKNRNRSSVFRRAALIFAQIKRPATQASMRSKCAQQMRAAQVRGNTAARRGLAAGRIELMRRNV
jgi:hypothetical protein